MSEDAHTCRRGKGCIACHTAGEESQAPLFDWHYARGFRDAVLASSWTCGDCGNTYDSGVDYCPNKVLDKARVSVRAAEHSAFDGDEQE